MPAFSLRRCVRRSNGNYTQQAVRLRWRTFTGRHWSREGVSVLQRLRPKSRFPQVPANRLSTIRGSNAIVLATNEEAPPLSVPKGVKFLGLVEGLNPEKGTASIAACRQQGAPVRFDGRHLSEPAAGNSTLRINS